MKKMSLLVLLLIILLSLSACGQKNPSDNTPSSIVQQLEFGNEIPNYNDEVLNSTQKTLSEAPQGSQQTPTNFTLYDAQPFSEGISWVRFKEGDGDLQIGWLHTDGSLTQPFPVNEVTGVGSDFSGGYATFTFSDSYLRETTGAPYYFLILNSSGDVTARSPSDGTDYQIVCGGDGLYLVKQSILSMTKNEERYGFIFGNGEWLMECAVCPIDGTHPLSLGSNPRQAETKMECSYLGEGIFQIEYKDKWGRVGLLLYNALQNKKVILDTSNIDNEAKVIASFSQGMTAIRTNIGAYMIDTSLNIWPIALHIDPDGIYSELIYSEGLLLAGENKYADGFLIDAKFYNADGTVKIDLSEYALIWRDTYNMFQFKDGYAALAIRGADNNDYLCIIDSNGNFTFDPKIIQLYSNTDYIGELSDGVIVCYAAEDIKIVNINGEEVITENLDTYQDFDYYSFHDGYTWSNKVSGFVGKDGQILKVYRGF